MRFIFVLTLTVVAHGASAADVGGFRISTLKGIVDDELKTKSYMDCMVDDVGCDDPKLRLKETLLVAMKNGCETCDKRQKVVVKELIRYFKKKRPDEYEKFYLRHDPKNEYKEKLEKFIGKAKKKKDATNDGSEIV